MSFATAWWLPFVVFSFAGLVHGTLGLGFPLVATPLLALTSDMREAILVTLLPTAVLNVASVLRGGNWGESVGRFWPLALWSVIGSAVGSRLLVTLDPRPFLLVLAALIGLYLLVSRADSLSLGWAQRSPRASMLVFGLLAGLSAGTTNVMVPILIIYTAEMGLDRTAMVQVFNLSFLCGKLAQIGVFAEAGEITGEVLVASLPLSIVALATLTAGARIRDRIPVETYRRAIRVVLAGLGLLLVGRYLAG